MKVANGSKPDIGPRRASRRRPPPAGDARTARFTRRLLSVMRDPTAALSKILCRELKGSSVRRLQQTLPAEAITAIRVARQHATGLCHLILLQGWRAFTASSGLPRSRAALRYVRWLRRHYVKTSQSGLYEYEAELNKHGLIALVPQWRGGRRRRIPAADWALLEDLCRGTNIYRKYQLLRRGAGLPGQPMSRSTVERLVKEFSEQAPPNVRQRATYRLHPGEKSSRA